MARRFTIGSPFTALNLMGRGFALWICTALALRVAAGSGGAAETRPQVQFHQDIQPILQEFCYDCHGDGANKGQVAFDELESKGALLDPQLWSKVLKNVRAGLMPPQKKPRPSGEQQQKIEQWIKYTVFGIDPQNPDPGRVTLRRLNRVEYRNTIRDLMGIDFDSEVEFPPDDTGYGFDNIGDVLTLSPMLLEKYLVAARSVVSEAVPTVGRMVAERILAGSRFRRAEAGQDPNDQRKSKKPGSPALSYYEAATVLADFRAGHPGSYHLALEMAVKGNFEFEPGRCRGIFRVDDRELLSQEFGWYDHKSFRFEFDQQWEAGDHRLSFAVEPLLPDPPKSAALELRVVRVTVSGPMAKEYWIRPKNYDRFFSRDAPENPADRRAYAQEILGAFTTKAFRRPADDQTIERLTALAESVYTQPGKTFEAGIAHAMIAVLASPRFLFRLEAVDPLTGSQPERASVRTPVNSNIEKLGQRVTMSSVSGVEPSPAGIANVDEFALASRLSYFLWSSMPDPELFRLAGRRELRQNLANQVRRMLEDPRSDNLVRNFTGQWLQTRDVDGISINARAVLARDNGQKRMRHSGEEFELDHDLRVALRRETEMFFASVVHEDRPVTDLIESDYTFLNENLAKLYGLTNLNVTGAGLRRVTLPADCPRGGVLTQGSTLIVTSNPDRTSPVKRGLFILENFLGTPPPPPPPNIPALEASEKAFKDHAPTLRETLQAHRDKPLCASCHERMDPIGLGFENFNALGMWREQERHQPLDPAGKLITGEAFTSVRELKHILAHEHRVDFYRCLTEKLLIYALGRGTEYYDQEAIDQIVDRLERENGRFSALLLGIVESAPFQKMRTQATGLAFNSNNPSAVGRTANQDRR